MIQVVMYTRQGCHLCDEAWTMLHVLAKKYTLDLQAIDVDGQAELIQQYGERVPVILVQGKEYFWGRINRVLVERLLRSLT